MRTSTGIFTSALATLTSLLLVWLTSTADAEAAPPLVERSVASAHQSQFASNQIVVRFRQGASAAAIQSLNAGHGAHTLKVHRLSGFYRLALPAGANLDHVLAAYRNSPLVEEAGLNMIVSAFGAPNDTNYSYQWHLQNTTGGMLAESAWDLSAHRGQGVTIAVIDTGVAYENLAPFSRAPDLAGKTFVTPWDFFNNDAHPNDDNGHGSHVAGTIAEDTNTSPPYGVAGVAYNGKLMPLKVLGLDGSGFSDDLNEAIYYAVNNGARIINLSLGFSGTGAPDANGKVCTEITGLNSALDYAYSHNTVVVAAAGNESATTVSCPAAYPTVIAVGATRFDGQVAFYSNHGSALDLTAPGGDPNVDQNGDGYSDGVLQETFCYDASTMDLYYKLFGISLYGDFCDVFYAGTSMAAPHVAGAAALLLSEDSSLTPDEVRGYLESTARDRGPIGWDSSYGWGALNASAAVAALLNTTPPPPPSSPTLHVGDLDGSKSIQGGRWRATVSIAVHNASEALIAGATVTGKWSGSNSASSCVTGSAGRCSVQSPRLSSSSVTFTVTNVSLAGSTYDASKNHDPDGDSNGTAITVTR